MNYRLKTKKPHTGLLIKLASVPSIGATLFTPGLPAIAKYFNIPSQAGQLALGVFLIGYVFGQLVYGPIANRFGRKHAIYVGLIIAILGSALSGLAAPLHSFTFFLFARFLTALGASVGLILTFTIINDYYYEHQARKVVPLVSVSFAIVPFLGVAIGGFLVDYFNWQSCFYFLTLYYLFVLWIVSYLPETGMKFEMDAIRLGVLAKKYRVALKDKRLVTFSVLYGIIVAFIYCFSASASLITINHFGLTAARFGLVNLVISFAYLVGNLCTAFFAKKFSGYSMVGWGFAIFGIATSAFFCFAVFGYLNVYTFFIPFMVAFFGFPIAYANAIVFASNHFEDRSSGSAIMNFICMGIAALSVLIIEILPGSLVYTFPSFLLSLVIIYLVLFIYSKKYVR